MKLNTKKYGLFYKSRGRWTGPYAGLVASKDTIHRELKLVRNVLKSKLSVRKVKFA